MKRKLVFVLSTVFCALTVLAQRQMEYLNRGIVAVPDGKGNILLVIQRFMQPNRFTCTI